MRKAVANRVELENSGLVLFLYDAANAKALRKAKLAIFDGYSPDVAYEDAPNKLVTIELVQDDDVVMQVSVGAPKDLPAQRARLDLPSGRLRIESYDSLQLSEE